MTNRHITLRNAIALTLAGVVAWIGPAMPRRAAAQPAATQPATAQPAAMPAVTAPAIAALDAYLAAAARAACGGDRAALGGYRGTVGQHGARDQDGRLADPLAEELRTMPGRRGLRRRPAPPRRTGARPG